MCCADINAAEEAMNAIQETTPHFPWVLRPGGFKGEIHCAFGCAGSEPQHALDCRGIPWMRSQLPDILALIEQWVPR